MAKYFKVLEVARAVVDDLNALMDASERPLLNEDQLRESAASIVANIREAYGRKPGRERQQFLRYARGSAEETDERLRVNFAANRLPANRYWQFHNRLDLIRKMLNGLLVPGPDFSEPDSRRSGRAAP